MGWRDFKMSCFTDTTDKPQNNFIGIANKDNSPKIPEKETVPTARRLIDELRTSKAEKANTVIPIEKTQPGANVKAVWPPDVQALIDWFIKLEPPTEPFYLEPHLHIIHPAKFFSSIWREIQTGHKGPRARMGTLQSDLRMLKARLN